MEGFTGVDEDVFKAVVRAAVVPIKEDSVLGVMFLGSFWGQSPLNHIICFPSFSSLPIRKHGKTDSLSVFWWMLSRDGAW